MELKHNMNRAAKIRWTLLIVPYGIETRCSAGGYSGGGSFNRTLWN